MSEDVTTIIKSQKCLYCGLQLTIPPIMKLHHQHAYYRCGRCKNISTAGYSWRNVSEFENVAKNLSFSCSYPQCKVKVPWIKMQEHEINCRYRSVQCPIYMQNCKTIVPAHTLLQHFKEVHNHNIETTGLFWNVNIAAGSVSLLVEENECFFVYLTLCSDNLYYIAVLSLESTKYTTFNVKLLPTSGENFEISFNNLPVARYDERLHCYRCVKRNCSVPSHPFSSKGSPGNMRLQSFMNVLKTELINGVKSSYGYLRYSLTLIPEEPTATPIPEEPTRDIPGAVNNIDVLKGVLSCPYCMTYMAAPIFTCITGHTICNVCKPKMKKCPTCLFPFGESRNYTLEELAKDAQVSCKHHDKGCIFTGTVVQVYSHEKECSFNDSLTE